MYYRHLKKILSENECLLLIEEGENIGFQQATVNYYGEQKKIDQVRNNTRIEWDNTILAKTLEEKLKTELQEEFPYLFTSQNLAFEKLGSHFRMYKYTPGQYFKPHKDGHFEENNLESMITVLFYLNDTEGGETVLMPYGYRYPQDFIYIKPKKGDVLIFDHNIWHEGKPVTSGQKYVLRTDMFYGKNN